MAYSAPINFATIENTLVDWVRTSTGLTTLWNGQNRTQKAKPFAELKRTAGPIKIGADELRRRMVDDELFTDVVGLRGLTYNLQVFSGSDAPGENAEHYLSIAQSALDHPAILEKFLAAKINLTGSTSITDLDAIVGTGFDSRASMDVTLEVVSNLVPAADQPTNWIETATATGGAGTITTQED